MGSMAFMICTMRRWILNKKTCPLALVRGVKRGRKRPYENPLWI
jgi:hypothetical protein